MRKYCDRISLSPDKWEMVELNIIEEVDDEKPRKIVVSVPRVRQIRGENVNAFKDGKFTKTFCKFAANSAIATIYGEAVQNSVAAYLRAEINIKKASAAIKDTTSTLVSVVDALLPSLKRAANLEKDETGEALYLYQSIITKLNNF